MKFYLTNETRIAIGLTEFDRIVPGKRSFFDGSLFQATDKITGRFFISYRVWSRFAVFRFLWFSFGYEYLNVTLKARRVFLLVGAFFFRTTEQWTPSTVCRFAFYVFIFFLPSFFHFISWFLFFFLVRPFVCPFEFRFRSHRHENKWENFTDPLTNWTRWVFPDFCVGLLVTSGIAAPPDYWVLPSF